MMSGRETTYGLLSAVGLLVPWYFNLQFLLQGGSFFDPAALFALGLANPVSSSFTLDLFIAFAAFAVWAFHEARRLGMRAAWMYPVLGLAPGLSFALPFLLYMRERHLRNSAQLAVQADGPAFGGPAA